jgi:hypothetical protein
MITMNKSSFLALFCLTALLFTFNMSFAQELKNKSVKLTNADASYTIQKVESGSQKIPSVMGGGEAPANSLMIVNPSWRGGKEVTPEALGVENLLPARWLDKEHFLFLGTDAVDIQDYFVYFSEEDKIYKCVFEVGEKIGYGAFEEGVAFEFTIENETITAFSVK